MSFALIKIHLPSQNVAIVSSAEIALRKYVRDKIFRSMGAQWTRRRAESTYTNLRGRTIRLNSVRAAGVPTRVYPTMKQGRSSNERRGDSSWAVIVSGNSRESRWLLSSSGLVQWSAAYRSTERSLPISIRCTTIRLYNWSSSSRRDGPACPSSAWEQLAATILLVEEARKIRKWRFRRALELRMFMWGWLTITCLGTLESCPCRITL